MKFGIVGAGIAGLALALAFEQDGHDVTVFEAASSVGGRMSTTEVDGYPLDNGFHVLHTAYPCVKRWIDVKALNAKPMNVCTASIQPSTGKRRLVGDALRRPQYLIPTLATLGLRDSLRFFAWRMRIQKNDLEYALDGTTATISESLQQRSFRPSTQRILKSLFTGITLDPSLRERWGFADFVWGAMSSGSMVVPKGGIVAVPLQMRSRLKNTHISLNSNVIGVTANTITCADQTHSFDHVVLAVPAHVASRFLSSIRPPDEGSERVTATVTFRVKNPPIHHARLLLNEEWGQDQQNILHIHLPTNLHPHPRGDHLLVVTLVGPQAIEPNHETIIAELSQWFGNEVYQWTHVHTSVVRFALPQTMNDARIEANCEIDGVLVAGDYRAHPSVQGALASAEAVLEHLRIPLPA